MGGLRRVGAPLMLFLRRLRGLDVRVVGTPDRSFRLSRVEWTLADALDSTSVATPADAKSRSCTVVDLGVEGRYFAAWRLVPEERVNEAIDESINQKRMGPRGKAGAVTGK